MKYPFRFYVGIDYSMTSPAATIWDSEADYYYVYNLNGSKKLHGKYEEKDRMMIFVDPIPEYKNNIERYTYISKLFYEFIMLVIKDHKAYVTMEGYAMGSRSGLIFNIAEHHQTLKLRLYNNPQLELNLTSPAPTTIKKYATDKGNADKGQVYDAFFAETEIDLEKIIGVEKEKSPVNDIADSFWICRYLVNETIPKEEENVPKE